MPKQITTRKSTAKAATTRKPKAEKATKQESAAAAPAEAAPAVPQAANSVKAEPMSLEQALKTAQTQFGKHILEVTQQGVKGNATRVKIKCTDPQQVQGVSVCNLTREIAIQDAFQVKRCTACQARIERKKRQAKRSEKAKARRAAAKVTA